MKWQGEGHTKGHKPSPHKREKLQKKRKADRQARRRVQKERKG